MRFRATIENVSTFFGMMQVIEKLQKRFIVKFTEQYMHLICNHDANEGGIQVWSQIKIDSIFTEYRIQSNSNNEITMNLSSEALLAALKSASASSSSTSAYQSEETVVKLAKKNDHAVLRFEIIGTTAVGRRVRVSHDVLVEVMKPSDVARLAEPLCPDPDLHILLPPLQKLRTIVERLRPMSDILAVQANNNGRLQISIDTDLVQVETEWRKLVNPKPHSDPEQPDNAARREIDPDRMFTVHVSLRSFLKFLNMHVISTTTIACICSNHCLILYVYIGDAADAGGVLTFYMPAIIDGD